MKLVVFASCVLGSTIGCTPYLHSPPATTFPLESAKVLNDGEWGIQGEIGGGGRVFGPTMITGVVRARHGLGHNLELSIQGSAIGITGDPEWTSDAHRGVYAGRLGIKYQVARFFSLTTGLGGGWSAGGGFISPDFGGIVGWENRYFVPFVTLGGYVSGPLNPQNVRFTSDDDEVFIGKPDTAVGWYTGVGFRVPVVHDDTTSTKPAFVFGFRAVGAAHNEPDGRQRDPYFVGTGGFEFIID